MSDITSFHARPEHFHQIISMCLALSYDHRIIDGKECVSFLYKVKEMIEDPNKLVFGGKDPGEVLLGL